MLGSGVECVGFYGTLLAHVQAEMTAGNLQIVAERDPAETGDTIGQGLADPALVASAVCASGDHAGDVDGSSNVRGVVVKAERRRTDAFHAGAGVDDENDRQIEFFGDQRGTGDVAVVQPHHPLDDADLPLAAAVVPSEALGTLEPVIERARGAAGDPLVVARINESGPAFAGWTTYPSRSSARQIASVAIVLPTPSGSR